MRRRSVTMAWAAGTLGALAVLVLAAGGCGAPVGPGTPAGPLASVSHPGQSTPAPASQDPASLDQGAAPPAGSPGVSPHGTPDPEAARAAGTQVERYTNDLVAGDDAAAWSMLAPASQAMWGSLTAYRAERSAYFASVKGRFAVVVSPPGLAPLSDWLTGLDTAGIDPAAAVLVEVTYPEIASRNAFSVYVVAPLGGRLVIYSVR